MAPRQSSTLPPVDAAGQGIESSAGSGRKSSPSRPPPRRRPQGDRFASSEPLEGNGPSENEEEVSGKDPDGPVKQQNFVKSRGSCCHLVGRRAAGRGEGRISYHCRLSFRYPARLHPRGMKKGSRVSALGSLNDLAEARKKTLRSSVPHLGPGDKLPSSGSPRPHLPFEGLRQALYPPSSGPPPCQVPQSRLQKEGRPVEKLAPEKTMAAVSTGRPSFCNRDCGTWHGGGLEDGG